MDIDVDRCKRLNGWLEGVELPPDINRIWAEARVGDPGYFLVMSAPDQPDVIVNGEMVAGGVSAYIGQTPRSRNSLVLDVMAALGMRSIHEAFEWVKVDGVRIADPHPAAGDYMWEWLGSRCRGVVEDYVNTFPGHTDWWVQVADWNGQVVYDGPSPCPDELCTLTPADVAAGRLYTFDVTPIHFDGSDSLAG